MSYSFTSFDEKSDYEQRRHRRNRASSSSTCNSSSSLMSEKSYENPPPYSNAFYNSLSEKPLPPLPLQQRRVRFAVEKPLPPLPEDQDRQRMLSSSASSGGDAWWAQEKRQRGEGEQLSEKSSS